MPPRKYDNSRRREAADATRRRIIDATFAVHDEQGIAGARVSDIAERAGVSPGTLYRHFPTYDDLVDACGHRTFQQTPPPTAEEAEAALEGVPAAEDRIRLAVDRIVSFYEQTGPTMEVMRRDSQHVPTLLQWITRLEAGIAAWVDLALADRPDHERRLARAILDHRTWTAMNAEGIKDVRVVLIRLLQA